MKKFIIVSTQRSGSAFLVTSLTSHPQIHCYREMFLSDSRDPDSYRIFKSTSMRRKLAHLLRRRQQVEMYLSELFSSYSDKDAIGFKFMYSQAREFPEVLQWVKNENVKIIHLIRSNILKMIVSLEVAKLRDIYHSTKRVEPISISLKANRLRNRLKNISRQVDEYRSLFEGCPYFELTYENFVANRDEETRRLLDFLEIAMHLPLSSNLVKLNPETLADLIENYEEVAQTLKGTEFERFL